jgi:hypothetical protein
VNIAKLPELLRKREPLLARDGSKSAALVATATASPLTSWGGLAKMALLSDFLEPRRFRTRVHDVAQSLTRISVVLVCHKAIPILASRALKVSLSGNRGVHTGRNVPKQIVLRTGLLLGCCARNACARHDRRDQE